MNLRTQIVEGGKYKNVAPLLERTERDQPRVEKKGIFISYYKTIFLSDERSGGEKGKQVHGHKPCTMRGGIAEKVV